MRLSTYILSLALFFTLIQCGGEDALSKNVGISISPSKPIIQNSDVIIPIGSGDATYTITAPFTSFGVTITNSSGQDLIVTGLRLETTYDLADDKTGVITTSTATADVSPASFVSQEITVKSRAGCTVAAGNCDQNYLAFIPSAETGNSFTLKALSGVVESDLRFYFTSLPENDGKNFVYRMKLSILGYFGTTNDISSRVNKSIYFTTF